jgi:hypothetical protein
MFRWALDLIQKYSSIRETRQTTAWAYKLA